MSCSLLDTTYQPLIVCALQCFDVNGWFSVRPVFTINFPYHVNYPYFRAFSLNQRQFSRKVRKHLT
jgi:hypothetical protein